MTWSDGKPLTADDVAFTIGLAKIKAVGSNIWDYVTDATATDAIDRRRQVQRPGLPGVGPWTYNSPIVPKHIWEAKANEDILKDTNANGVGSGPYMYKTATEDRMVWVQNDNWWGKTALSLDVKPKYIVDIVNGANNVALGLLLQGGIDLSNNFLPGIATLVDQGYVIDLLPGRAVHAVGEHGLARHQRQEAAARRPGLPPGASPTRSTSRTSSTRSTATSSRPPTRPASSRPGTSTSTPPSATRSASSTTRRRPRRILDAAGYKKGGDGFVTNKDGSPIKLTIMVPSGWSDWEAARDVIVASLKDVGINTEAKVTDYNGLVARPQRRQLRPGHQQRSPDLATRPGPTTTTCSASRS